MKHRNSSKPAELDGKCTVVKLSANLLEKIQRNDYWQVGRPQIQAGAK